MSLLDLDWLNAELAPAMIVTAMEKEKSSADRKSMMLDLVEREIVGLLHNWSRELRHD